MAEGVRVAIVASEDREVSVEAPREAPQAGAEGVGREVPPWAGQAAGLDEACMGEEEHEEEVCRRILTKG